MRALSFVTIKMDFREKLRQRKITKLEEMTLKICITH